MIPGDTVYNLAGAKAVLVAAIEGSFIVRPFTVTEWEEDIPTVREGNVEEWPEVFENPPKHVIESEMESLLEQKVALEAEIGNLWDLQQYRKRESTQRIERIVRHPKLAQLEEFIEGKITHFAVFSYGAPKVISLQEAKRSEDRYAKEIKLLCLFGNTNGDINWKINDYNDGSGSWTEVVPCTSEEQAVNVIKERAKDLFDSYTANDIHRLQYWIEASEKYGFDVPDVVRRESFDHQIKYAEDLLKRHDQGRQELQRSIDTIRAKFQPQPTLPT